VWFRLLKTFWPLVSKTILLYCINSVNYGLSCFAMFDTPSAILKLFPGPRPQISKEEEILYLGNLQG
jgi:hypothetical protein